MTRGRLLVAGAVVLGLLAAAWAAPRVARSVSDSLNQVSGRDDLKVLERDGILAFRAPGATLRGTTKHPASRGAFGQSYEPTTVEQIFAIQGDPVAAVEAYRDRAAAEGWRLVAPWCSRYHRTAALLFAKTTPIQSSMTVRVVLSGSSTAGVAPSDTATATDPPLTVTLTALGAPVPELDGVSLPKGDVGCLRSVDPGDPAFQVRPGPPRTSAELCALLPVSMVARIVPEVTVAVAKEPDHLNRSTCSYEQRPYAATSTVLPIQGVKDSLWWFSVVDATMHPRVMYEDTQHPSTAAGADMFLLALDTERTGPPIGVWVDAPSGPVVVTSYVNGLSEQQLLALARRVHVASP